MAMVTETATRKRVYSLQFEKNPSWLSPSFAPRPPFGLANGSEITPPFEKRLRTEKKPMSTFKWEPDLPASLQFSVGHGYRNVEVKTPLRAAWQDRPFRGLSTPPYVRNSRLRYEGVKEELRALATPPYVRNSRLRYEGVKEEMRQGSSYYSKLDRAEATATPPYVRNSRLRYEGVKEEMRQGSSWFSKLDRAEAEADDALDSVGGPVIGLNLTLGPTESYFQKYVNAKRELEDYKRVVNAVNSSVPLTSNGSHAEFSSLEGMRRRGSNLQQGPRNLYSIQEAVLRESQTGGGHSNSRMANGDAFRRTEYDEARRRSELEASDAATGSGPESRVQPVGASVASHDHDEAHVPKQHDERNEDWRTLYMKAQVGTPGREARDREIEAVAESLSRIQLGRVEDQVRRQKERDASKKEEVIEALLPLSAEAEQDVKDALCGSSNEVLAFHEETNIEVTRAIMQCLLPGAWLNDEVINVYMQLLKERENRSPDKFLKCHFFNTFFYNKLFKDKRSYDYKSVRRWTTQRKIGYSLADCDKILVPIHQDIHWCLAVINIRDQKFEYLDSLSGRDENVLRVLARYLIDEAKDKNNLILDVSKWESVFPQDIPEQLNGCDCGMFMLKYADFHSRGGSLSFTQAHMEYFRRRTVYEILQNKAT